MKILFLLTLAATMFVSGCRPTEPEPDPSEREAVVKAGEEASQALLQSLGGQLKAALQSGGPASAMHICQQVAGLSTKAIGDSYDIRGIRRTTLKPRNPGNAPDEMDRRVLTMLEKGDTLPEHHIEWTDATGHYYKPLVIQEVCLKCHGNPDDFPPELRDKIAMLYPDDRATGYGLGELRGVIRVDVARSAD